MPHTGAEKDAVLGYCAESFAALADYARLAGINVLIENHWGLSSDPAAIVKLVQQVGKTNFGTLPDFGNFPMDVDRYAAVKEMMPFGKGVSFKCYDFADGKETSIYIDRMLKIVIEAGYHGFVGIEYEGNRLSELEGARAGKVLLDRYAV
jgi:sugar phosphate isomerase/epimerase